jgi:hypothetical protein
MGESDEHISDHSFSKNGTTQHDLIESQKGHQASQNHAALMSASNISLQAKFLEATEHEKGIHKQSQVCYIPYV